MTSPPSLLKLEAIYAIPLRMAAEKGGMVRMRMLQVLLELCGR